VGEWGISRITQQRLLKDESGSAGLLLEKDCFAWGDQGRTCIVDVVCEGAPADATHAACFVIVTGQHAFIFEVDDVGGSGGGATCNGALQTAGSQSGADAVRIVDHLETGGNTRDLTARKLLASDDDFCVGATAFADHEEGCTRGDFSRAGIVFSRGCHGAPDIGTAVIEVTDQLTGNADVNDVCVSSGGACVKTDSVCGTEDARKGFHFINDELITHVWSHSQSSGHVLGGLRSDLSGVTISVRAAASSGIGTCATLIHTAGDLDGSSIH